MVVASTPDGEIGILPLHAPIVTTLAPGEVRLRFGDGAADWEFFSISGGYLQVHEDKVIVLADAAVAVSQIDAASRQGVLRAHRGAPCRAAGRRRGRARRDDPRPELERDPAQGRREARRSALAARETRHFRGRARDNAGPPPTRRRKVTRSTTPRRGQSQAVGYAHTHGIHHRSRRPAALRRSPR